MTRRSGMVGRAAQKGLPAFGRFPGQDAHRLRMLGTEIEERRPGTRCGEHADALGRDALAVAGEDALEGLLEAAKRCCLVRSISAR